MDNRWWTVFIGLLVLSCELMAKDEWVAVRDVSLEIQANSILDFTAISPNLEPIVSPVMPHESGQFVVENNPTKPKRFLIGSLGFGVNMGSFPNHALIERYVKQYKLRGYNMVRLDFVESLLMEGRKADFDFDPEQLDRFHYLVYQLKQNGLYLILNGLSNGNGGYGNIQERWLGKKRLHAALYFDPGAQTHWKQLIRAMYGSVNPYTGLTTLNDPVLAGLIMVNEGNLVFLNRNGVAPNLRPHFADWLKQKYGNRESLKQAWGKELTPEEHLHDASVAFPSPDAWTSKRMADTQAFFFEAEQKAAIWMEHYLRSLGFKGAVTSYNLWHAPAAHAIRGQLPWVDMHHYFAHPEYLANGEIRVNQDSMLKKHAAYIQEIAIANHAQKPFTVSEHGQVFWNRYRRENALAMPAYAAFQGWDGICQHSGAVDLSYAPTVGRKDIIHPFAVGTDPIARVGETLAALLYLRGDVAPARYRVGVHFDKSHAFEESAHLGSMPSDITKLALLHGVALDWQGSTFRASSIRPYDAKVDLSQTGISFLAQNTPASQVSDGLLSQVDRLVKQNVNALAYPISKVGLFTGSRWADKVTALRRAGWLSQANQTNAETGVYQSDSEQILLNSEQQELHVISPKTEAVVFDRPNPITLKNLTVLNAEKGALVSASAMDNAPLAESKKILLMLATDARNHQMRFSDPGEQVAVTLGKKPVMLLANKVTLRLKNAHASKLKLYSTNLRGQRMDAIKLKHSDNSIEFSLDIRALSHGATTYFEISV